jgi:DNA-binding LacI/PurR family transcriptional regulator
MGCGRRWPHTTRCCATRLRRTAASCSSTPADELGIAVPQQLSLVGYDNTYLAGIRHIGLTTVDNASHEVGRRAADALVRRIAAPTRPEVLQLIVPKLQVRESSGPVTRAASASST